MKGNFILALFFILLCSGAFAISVAVNPSTGTNGSNPTDTIGDAIAQVLASPDADNTITLRSTEGPHILPDDPTWDFGYHNCDIVAESGQPIIVLNSAGRRGIVDITACSTSTLSFSDIAVIPETGLTYADNVGDGFRAYDATYVFANVVFSANDGSNGVASQEADVDFASLVNNVGDDWFQFYTLNDVTFSNCTITGAWDDALLFGGGTGADPQVVTLDQGTVIANIGGAGIQVYEPYCELLIDGSAGRVLIAKLGLRSGTNDTGIKFFYDMGCDLDITKCDIIDCTYGSIFDFDGVPTIDITDSRIAYGNTDDVATAGLLAIDDAYADSAYGQTINITRCTFHAAGGSSVEDAIVAQEGANEPYQAYNIIDSIFSGSGDTYANMKNDTGAAGSSVSQTFCAVVTAGPDAIANSGDLGSGAVSTDPQYLSYNYTIGRAQYNTNFLQPQNTTDYGTAGSGGALLNGGAPPPGTGVYDWNLY